MHQLEIQLKTPRRHVRYERPRDIRFPLTQRGELIHNGTRVPCLIQDVSMGGISGICTRYVEVGQQFEVTFELCPGHIHDCRIELLYVDNGNFGAKILDTSRSKIFDKFIDDKFKELKRR